jgi:hypothetical protein
MRDLFGGSPAPSHISHPSSLIDLALSDDQKKSTIKLGLPRPNAYHGGMSYKRLSHNRVNGMPWAIATICLTVVVIAIGPGSCIRFLRELGGTVMQLTGS